MERERSAYVIVDRDGNPVPVERTGPHTSELWLRRQYPNREPLPPGRLLGPRDPHPTCWTERGKMWRRVYRTMSRHYGRTGEGLDVATDALCLWITAEEDARVAHERWTEDALQKYAAALAPIVPKWRPRWLARVWPWWG